MSAPTTAPLPIHTSWGGLTFALDPSMCVVCGDPSASPAALVPADLAGGLYGHETNAEPLCLACRKRWMRADGTVKLLAAALLVRGYPNLPFRDGSDRGFANRLSAIGLRLRDGMICRVCEKPSGRTHGGHVLSRFEGERWGLPEWLYDDQANVVTMCEGCNVAIGWHSPPLRLGMRYLMKPWIETNHNKKERER